MVVKINRSSIIKRASIMLDDQQADLGAERDWLRDTLAEACPEGHEDDEPWRSLYAACEALEGARVLLEDAREKVDRINDGRTA